MTQYLDLEKAVDYLIDKTPEGEPFRDGSVFVRGDLFKIKVDPAHPLHGKVFEVIRTGRNDAGEAMVSFRPENPSNPDRRIQADLCRHSDQQYPDPQERRRRFALPLIVRACADGTWKARGQRPNSAEWEDIPNTDFNGSEIGDYTSDLITTPDGMPKNPDNEEVIWRRVMVSVPSGTDEGEAAELPEPTDPRSSVVRPKRPGRKKGSGGYDSEDAPLVEEIEALVDNEKPMGLWNAALSVADRAPGTGNPESKAKRLVIKYKKKRSTASVEELSV